MSLVSELTYEPRAKGSEHLGMQIYLAAEEAFSEVSAKLSPEERLGRNGGIIKVRVAEAKTDVMRGWRRVRLPDRPFIGLILDDAHIDSRDHHAMEKIIRVMKSAAKDTGPACWNSWEHRDPNRGEYQGAILFEDVQDPRLGRGYIRVLIGFSGTLEWADEAVCYLVAEKMGWTTRVESHMKARQTGMGNRTGGNTFYTNNFPLAA